MFLVHGLLQGADFILPVLEPLIQKFIYLGWGSTACFKTVPNVAHQDKLSLRAQWRREPLRPPFAFDVVAGRTPW